MAWPGLRCRSGGADAPSGADATAPVGEEPRRAFVAPGPHMTAIPPVFGPCRPAVHRRFAQWSRARVRGPASLRDPRRARRRKESRTGSGALEAVGVRATRGALSGPNPPTVASQDRQSTRDHRRERAPYALERVFGLLDGRGLMDLSPSGAYATWLSWSSGRRTRSSSPTGPLPTGLCEIGRESWPLHLSDVALKRPGPAHPVDQAARKAT